MNLSAALLTAVLARSLSASATTIPPDLAARAGELRKGASPQVLAWVHEQASALAKARGPVDVAALQAAARSRFGKKQSVPGTSAGGTSATTYKNLGSMGDGDIMAIAFIVLMEAAKSAQEDLKAIMAGVKAINKDKESQRQRTEKIPPMGPTATPTPDRVALLVAAARGIVGRTHTAKLSLVAPR